MSRFRFSPTRIDTHWSKFTSSIDDVLAEIGHNELQRRREAAKHAAKVMRKNVSRKGRSKAGEYPGRKTGYLRRNIAFRLDKHDRSAIVGSKSPHAHLLEFGHGDGRERNKRPFVFRSLLEAEDEIVKIMSREYF